MTTSFHDPVEISSSAIAPGLFPRGWIDSEIANGAIYGYAHARRNVLGLVHNVSSTLTLTAPANSAWTPWLVGFPLHRRVEYPGTLKVCVLCSVSSEAPANTVTMKISTGSGDKFVDLDSPTLAWQEVEFDLDVATSAARALSISFRIDDDGGSNTVTIESVSAYQPEYDSATIPDWVDTGATNTRQGFTDCAASTAQYNAMNNDVINVLRCKVPRSNVFNHSFIANEKTSASYRADDRGLGAYKFVKRRGVSELKLHMLGRCGSAVLDDCTIQGDIDGDTQDDVLSGSSLQWVTLTWTLTGSDITDELELELKLDGKNNGDGNTIHLIGVYLCETSGSAVSHTVPDPAEYGETTVIAAADVANINNTTRHIWEQQGRELSIGDWRTSDDGTGVFAAANTALDKEDYAAKTCVARALAFSSYGSSRLRVGMMFGISEAYAHKKMINIQLSETPGTLATAIDANPKWEDGTHEFYYQDVSLFSMRRSWEEYYGLIPGGWDAWPELPESALGAIESCELDIRSADWEEHYDGSNEPPMVYVLAGTSDAGDWIEPGWVAIEEIPLDPTEI